MRDRMAGSDSMCRHAGSPGPGVTASRSGYPNISAFTERGQIVIGYMEPVGAVAIASEGRQTLAMLRRRKVSVRRVPLDER
jgi:hypothetical protein